jgi:hypothetical protein
VQLRPELHRERLFHAMERFHCAMCEAGFQYRVVGGMASLLHVRDHRPGRERVTPGIDVLVEAPAFEAVSIATLSVRQQSLASAIPVGLLVAGQRVHADDIEPLPELGEPILSAEGFMLASVADLVRMKLVAFRPVDQLHIQDMNRVRLITPAIVANLSDLLRERLEEVRAMR